MARPLRPTSAPSRGDHDACNKDVSGASCNEQRHKCLVASYAIIDSHVFGAAYFNFSSPKSRHSDGSAVGLALILPSAIEQTRTVRPEAGMFGPGNRRSLSRLAPRTLVWGLALAHHKLAPRVWQAKSRLAAQLGWMFLTKNVPGQLARGGDGW